MNGTCTRCGHISMIRASGTLDWGVPYALCVNCHGVFRGLVGAAAAAFTVDLWQRGAVRSLETRRHA
jgi:hypothetical protein